MICATGSAGTTSPASSPTGADGVPPAGLRLTGTRTSAGGVTMLTYDSAGEPTFGTVM